MTSNRVSRAVAAAAVAVSFVELANRIRRRIRLRVAVRRNAIVADDNSKCTAIRFVDIRQNDGEENSLILLVCLFVRAVTVLRLATVR